MADAKSEKLFTHVTILGDIGFADNNREGRVLLPDTGKSSREAMDFYRSMASVDKDGHLFIPDARNAKNAHEYYTAIDAFKNKVHAALGTKNPDAMTPAMIALSKKMSDEAERKKLTNAQELAKNLKARTAKQPIREKDQDRER